MRGFGVNWLIGRQRKVARLSSFRPFPQRAEMEEFTACEQQWGVSLLCKDMRVLYSRPVNPCSQTKPRPSGCDNLVCDHGVNNDCVLGHFRTAARSHFTMLGG